jgi:hypothetical protein
LARCFAGIKEAGQDGTSKAGTKGTREYEKAVGNRVFRGYQRIFGLLLFFEDKGQ